MIKWILNFYKIYNIKKWYRLKNGYFNMISYYDNPYYITNHFITNCKGEKQDLTFFRYGNHNINRDLVRQ
jgi:hypothetical protein